MEESSNSCKFEFEFEIPCSEESHGGAVLRSKEKLRGRDVGRKGVMSSRPSMTSQTLMVSGSPGGVMIGVLGGILGIFLLIILDQVLASIRLIETWFLVSLFLGWRGSSTVV